MSSAFAFKIFIFDEDIKSSLLILFHRYLGRDTTTTGTVLFFAEYL